MTPVATLPTAILTHVPDGDTFTISDGETYELLNRFATQTGDEAYIVVTIFTYAMASSNPVTAGFVWEQIVAHRQLSTDPANLETRRIRRQFEKTWLMIKGS